VEGWPWSWELWTIFGH